LTTGTVGRAGASLIAGVVTLGSTADAARAQDKSACATAYVSAQVERRQGHLKASRQQLLVCSQPSCSVLQGECAKWLSDVEAALPSVVFEATGPAGSDISDVQVTCDGAPLLSHLDGSAASMDPGVHRCRFESGGAVREQQSLLHEGEQRRPWRVSFAQAADGTAGQAAHAPAWAWTLGAVGVAAIGVGSYFELHGFAQKSDLSQCRGTCQQSAVDAAHTSFVVGDVTIGVGLAAVAVAAIVVFALPHRSAPSTSAWLGVRPRVSPNGARLEWAF
jgi:hypothetical protein